MAKNKAIIVKDREIAVQINKEVDYISRQGFLDSSNRRQKKSIVGNTQIKKLK